MSSLFQLIAPPSRHGVKLGPRHSERELEVDVREVLLEVAAVNVCRQPVIRSEERVQRVGLVLPREGRGRARARGQSGNGRVAHGAR